MSRRDNTRFRCARCRMLGNLCVCSLMPSPRLETRTRLVLIIHRLEDRKPTNTGRLATECLANSEVIVRGHESEPTAPFESDPGSQPLFLFPHDDAIPLDRLLALARPERPITLVVPDGNWRQASKVRNRVSGLREVPCVSLPLGEPTTYRLRAEAHATGLSTLEAIARSMGTIEGSHVRDALELVLDAMVERTLWARGAFETDAVTGGIPHGTLRHDPRVRSIPGGGTRDD